MHHRSPPHPPRARTSGGARDVRAVHDHVRVPWCSVTNGGSRLMTNHRSHRPLGAVGWPRAYPLRPASSANVASIGALSHHLGRIVVVAHAPQPTGRRKCAMPDPLARRRRATGRRARVFSTRLVWEGAERDLQRDADMPYGYYEILVMLSAPGRSPDELADATQSSRSRLCRGRGSRSRVGAPGSSEASQRHRRAHRRGSPRRSSRARTRRERAPAPVRPVVPAQLRAA